MFTEIVCQEYTVYEKKKKSDKNTELKMPNLPETILDGFIEDIMQTPTYFL